MKAHSNNHNLEILVPLLLATGRNHSFICYCTWCLSSKGNRKMESLAKSHNGNSPKNQHSWELCWGNAEGRKRIMTEAFFNHSKDKNGASRWKAQIDVGLITYRTAHNAVIPLPYLITLPKTSQKIIITHETSHHEPHATAECKTREEE